MAMSRGKTDKKRNGGASIRTRIAFPVIVVLLVQTVLYVALLSQGGLVSHIDNNAFDVFYRQTDNLGLYFENEMIHRWSSIGRSEEEVLLSVEETLKRYGASYADIQNDAELNEAIIADASSDVIELLRRNSVTGAFLILDGVGISGEDVGSNCAAFYIRDNDPTTYSEGNSDLLLERGLPAVAKQNNLTLDSYWSALVYEDDTTDFFRRPMDEAKKDEAPVSTYYGYWSQPFRLSGEDRAAVAYTIPLISEDGQVFGALGVDISLDYLTSKIKSNNYSQEEATFALTLGRDESTTMETVAQSGGLITQYFGSVGELKLQPKKQDEASNTVKMDVEQQGNGTLYGCVRKLKLYNVNTPFEDEAWSIVGIQEERTLLGLSRQLRSLVYIISAFMLLLGAAAITMVVVSITRPVKTLLNELERSDPVQPVSLPKLGIKEIDRLSASIEQLSRSVAESASRFSKIIQKTNVLLGVFEYQMGGSVVYCSSKLFEVLCWENEEGGDRYLKLEDFQARMNSLELYEGNGDVSTYQIVSEGKERWVSITSIEDGGNHLGVAVDISEQVSEKRKIEYERDYDLLTKLHNRRAFLQDMDVLFAHPERLKTAAILMWDLDNLKYINDTYGHDYGDKYIVGFAKALGSSENGHCRVARRSGDEFYLFYYGFDSKEEIMREIAAVCRRVEQSTFLLPNGNEYKVRASGGIAWYPQDAGNISDLIRYADFAMYSVKHTTKGAVEEFDPEEWRKNSLLVNGQEAFDSLIDHSMVDFAFQPILEVKSGSVYGYEALMRPQVPQFSDPEDVLRVARSQSKLFMVEKLTLFGVMRSYALLVAEEKIASNCKVFINSLPNQCLMEGEVEALTKAYDGLLSNVVLEITESEAIDSDFQNRKRKIVDDWGGEIAIDDYGAGYNSLSSLFRIVPDILKVDISVIHHIDSKRDNQKLLESIIVYSHQHGIQVLAEGVETAGELETCVGLGVDLLQGYHIGRPKFEIEAIKPEVLEEIRTALK